MSKLCIVFDLDDTLYKEIEFLKSGFRFIVEKLQLTQRELIYENMLRKYQSGEDAFDYIKQLYCDIDKDSLLKWYRSHKPNICMNADTIACLNNLKERGIILGLITDGRSLTQRNKIEALKLDKFFNNDNIVISEEIGAEKPSRKSYNYFSHKYPQNKLFYVGDNSKKDFIAPNELGWTTIGLRDNGKNIHSQVRIGGSYEPQIWINNILEIARYL